MQPTPSSMPAGAWIALAAFVLAFIVQLVVVVRHYTKLEGSIQIIAKDMAHNQDNVSKDFGRLTDRVERVERKMDESKVVMLRPHLRGGP